MQIVQHDPHHLGLGGALVHQPLHLVGAVALSTVRGHLHLPPAGLRLDAQAEVARAMALLLVINALTPARLGWQAGSRLCDPLRAGLVEGDLRPFGSIRLGIPLQDILHTSDELGIDRRQTSWFLPPRLQCVFVSTRRTASYEYWSVKPSATTRSASNGNVQRWRPAGAALHASAMSRASAVSSSLGFFPGRGRSCKASSPHAPPRRRVWAGGAPNPYRLGDRRLSATGGRFEQHPGAGELTTGMPTGAQQLFEWPLLLRVKRDKVFCLGPCRSCS